MKGKKDAKVRGVVLHTTLREREGKILIKEVLGAYLEGIASAGPLEVLASVSDREGGGGFQTRPAESASVRVIPVRDGGVGARVRKAACLFRMILRWDEVLVFLPSLSGVAAGMLCRLLGKPYSVYQGGRWPGRGGRGIVEWGEGVAVGGARFTLVAGSALRERALRKNPRVVETLPVFNLRQEDIRPRSWEGVSPSRACLLFVGSLSRNKGVHDLLSAFAGLRGDLDLELDIAGTGPEGDNLRKMAESGGLGSRVRFHGYVENGPRLFDLYRRADIFVLPSYCEGFPRVLYEAMAFGNAIVTTGVGGIGSLMRNGENALLVGPGRTEELRDAIRLAVTDLGLRRRLAGGCYRVMESLDPRPASQQYLECRRRYLEGP